MKYVYMAKMLEVPDCYKIGSTSDFIGRENTIRKDHGDCEIFLIGECEDALKVERSVQQELRDFANVRIYGKESVNAGEGKIVGSKNSVEFFTLSPIQMLKAMHILVSRCSGFDLFNPGEVPYHGKGGAA